MNIKLHKHDLQLTKEQANEVKRKLPSSCQNVQKEFKKMFHNLILTRRAKNVKYASIASKIYQEETFSASFWLAEVRLRIIDESEKRDLKITAYGWHRTEQKKAENSAFGKMLEEVKMAKFYINLVSVFLVEEHSMNISSIRKHSKNSYFFPARGGNRRPKLPWTLLHDPNDCVSL